MPFHLIRAPFTFRNVSPPQRRSLYAPHTRGDWIYESRKWGVRMHRQGLIVYLSLVYATAGFIPCIFLWNFYTYWVWFPCYAIPRARSTPGEIGKVSERLRFALKMLMDDYSKSENKCGPTAPVFTSQAVVVEGVEPRQRGQARQFLWYGSYADQHTVIKLQCPTQNVARINYLFQGNIKWVGIMLEVDEVWDHRQVCTLSL